MQYGSGQVCSERDLVPVEMFRDVEATLTGSLPCIHEIDPVTGEHSTSEAAPEGAANYVHTGTLTRMSEENDVKIQRQVFDPIDKWISEVDVSNFSQNPVLHLILTVLFPYTPVLYRGGSTLRNPEQFTQTEIC